VGSSQLSEAPKYSSTAIILHWIVAALILVNVVLGFGANYVPDKYARGFVDLHKSVGITILGLAILRILWRLTHKPPPMPSKYSPLEQWSAHFAHWLLYVLIFAIPLSGWLHDSAWKDAAAHPVFLYGVIPWPRIGFIQNPRTGRERTSSHLSFQCSRLPELCALSAPGASCLWRAEASVLGP
jgi:cytochrome b561